MALLAGIVWCYSCNQTPSTTGQPSSQWRNQGTVSTYLLPLHSTSLFFLAGASIRTSGQPLQQFSRFRGLHNWQLFKEHPRGRWPHQIDLISFVEWVFWEKTSHSVRSAALMFLFFHPKNPRQTILYLVSGFHQYHDAMLQHFELIFWALHPARWNPPSLLPVCERWRWVKGLKVESGKMWKILGNMMKSKPPCLPCECAQLVLDTAFKSFSMHLDS